MARIFYNTFEVKVSKILKDSDKNPSESLLTDDQQSTLQEAVEGLLVDNPELIVEVRDTTE